MSVTPARPRRREEGRQSLLSYCLQGASFLAFLLFLFWMAGFKLA